MKMLATGDLHLGASPDLGARPGDRLFDQGAIWRRVCERAVEQEVDALLFAGDAFHRRRPTPSEIVAFRAGVELLDEHDIEVIAIPGNHDVEAYGLPNAIETTPQHGKFHISTRPEVVQVAETGTYVATLPWTPPSRLIASRGGGDRDAVHADVAQLLVQSAAELRSQVPEGQPCVLLAHWSVSGAALPTGLMTDVLREPVLPLVDLLLLGYDAVVLGHIHKPQLISPGQLVVNGDGSHIVGSPCPVFYVGSPCVVDWGEAGFAHGAWTLYMDETRASFHPLEDRQFLTLDIDLTTETAEPAPSLDGTDRLGSLLAERLPLAGSLVRLRYKATAEQARHLNLDAIRGFCDDAGVAKLVLRPEILRADRVRVEGVDESLSELEALTRWSDVQDLDPIQRDRLATLTTDYLEAA